MNPVVMTTGPRGEQGDGDRVEELAVGQPAVGADHPAVQERHDRQAGAEHERASLAEVDRDLPQHPGIGRRSGHGGGRQRECQGGHASSEAREPQLAGSGPDQPDQHPCGQDQQAVLGLGDQSDHGDDQEDGGQQPVVAQGAAGELGGLVGDDGDDRGTNAIEQGLEQVQALVGDVGPAGDQDHDERRGREGQADQGGTEQAVAGIAEVDGELGGQGAGGELGQGQAFFVVLLADPPALLDQVAVHVAGEGDRAAEPDGAQGEEVADQWPEPDLLGRRRGAGWSCRGWGWWLGWWGRGHADVPDAGVVAVCCWHQA
jgi:hypothetical protein